MTQLYIRLPIIYTLSLFPNEAFGFILTATACRTKGHLLLLPTLFPTWFGRLGVRRRRGGGGGVLVDGSLGQRHASARRKLHAQLLGHLHVVAGVDVVERTAAGQLHLQATRREDTGLPYDLEFRNCMQATRWCSGQCGSLHSMETDEMLK